MLNELKAYNEKKSVFFLKKSYKITGLTFPGL